MNENLTSTLSKKVVVTSTMALLPNCDRNISDGFSVPRDVKLQVEARVQLRPVLVEDRLVPGEILAVLPLDRGEGSPKLRANVRTERSQHNDGATQSSLKFWEKTNPLKMPAISDNLP